MSSRYEIISTMLSDLEVTISAAEAHGVLVGLLTTQPSGVSKTHWFTELLDIAGASAGTIATKSRELKELDSWFSDSVQNLNDPEMAFQLFLPSDDASFISRQNALSDFCAGFNYGFGIGMAGKSNIKLPSDTRELLEDFQAIEGADPAKGDQSDENDFVEISEYVRMGVLFVYEELQPIVRPDADSPPSDKVH